MKEFIKNVKIRLAEKNDWLFILKLRNQKNVRQSSNDMSTIPIDDHVKYMIKLHNEPNSFHWIVMYDDIDVGYIKIINSELSSFFLIEYTAKGIGTKSYELMFLEARKLGLKKLFATVKIERLTPLTFEEKLGWVKKKTLYKHNKPYGYLIEKILN